MDRFSAYGFDLSMESGGFGAAPYATGPRGQGIYPLLKLRAQNLAYILEVIIQARPATRPRRPPLGTSRGLRPEAGGWRLRGEGWRFMRAED